MRIAGDAKWAHGPNLIPFRTRRRTYVYGIVNAADHAMKKLHDGSKTWCAMTEADNTGDGLQQGTDFAAQKLGFKVVQKVTFSVQDHDLTPQNIS